MNYVEYTYNLDEISNYCMCICALIVSKKFYYTYVDKISTFDKCLVSINIQGVMSKTEVQLIHCLIITVILL